MRAIPRNERGAILRSENSLAGGTNSNVHSALRGCRAREPNERKPRPIAARPRRHGVAGHPAAPSYALYRHAVHLCAAFGPRLSMFDSPALPDRTSE